jgi:hypothetical protein
MKGFLLPRVIARAVFFRTKQSPIGEEIASPPSLDTLRYSTIGGSQRHTSERRHAMFQNTRTRYDVRPCLLARHLFLAQHTISMTSTRDTGTLDTGTRDTETLDTETQR